MKVFKVKNEKYGYCDDIECIVVAESKKALRKKFRYDGYETSLTINGVTFRNYFQGKITIEEVDLSKEAILCVDNMGA